MGTLKSLKGDTYHFLEIRSHLVPLSEFGGKGEHYEIEAVGDRSEVLGNRQQAIYIANLKLPILKMRPQIQYLTLFPKRDW